AGDTVVRGVAQFVERVRRGMEIVFRHTEFDQAAMPATVEDQECPAPFAAALFVDGDRAAGSGQRTGRCGAGDSAAEDSDHRRILPLLGRRQCDRTLTDADRHAAAQPQLACVPDVMWPRRVPPPRPRECAYRWR